MPDDCLLVRCVSRALAETTFILTESELIGSSTSELHPLCFWGASVSARVLMGFRELGTSASGASRAPTGGWLCSRARAGCVIQSPGNNLWIFFDPGHLIIFLVRHPLLRHLCAL
jgi:hypothetical protein